MRCACRIVPLVLLLAQAPKPAPTSANQDRPPTSGAASSSRTVVLPASPREAAECTRGLLQRERWRVVRSTPSELRSFRYVTAEELKRIAQGPRDSQANWWRARVDLIVSFAAAESQATRVELRARILAEAETSAPALRPTNLQLLASTGALEGELIAALQARCGAEAKPLR